MKRNEADVVAVLRLDDMDNGRKGIVGTIRCNVKKGSLLLVQREDGREDTWLLAATQPRGRDTHKGDW